MIGTPSTRTIIQWLALGLLSWAATLASAYNIPRAILKGPELDHWDWATASFEVDALAPAAPEYWDPQARDARLWLAWNESGLWVRVAVADSTPAPARAATHTVWSGDCIELYLGQAVGSANRVTFGIGPDPLEPNTAKSTLVDDRAQKKLHGPYLPKCSVRPQPGGWIYTALLPWNGLLEKAEVGAPMSFQIYVPDYDRNGQLRGRLVWFPSQSTHLDPWGAHGLRLAHEADAPVRLSVMVEDSPDPKGRLGLDLRLRGASPLPQPTLLHPDWARGQTATQSSHAHGWTHLRFDLPYATLPDLQVPFALQSPGSADQTIAIEPEHGQLHASLAAAQALPAGTDQPTLLAKAWAEQLELYFATPEGPAHELLGKRMIRPVNAVRHIQAALAARASGVTERPPKVMAFYHAFLSTIDGTPQLSGVQLPRDYTAERAWPVIVELYDAGITLKNIDPQSHGGDYIRIVADGRGTGRHQGILERDLWDLLDSLAQTLRLDADRLHIIGRGTAATDIWRLANQYPGRLASLNLAAGRFALDWPDNLGETTVSLFHDRDDRKIWFGSSVLAADTLRRRGKPVFFMESSGYGHNWGGLQGRNLLAWAVAEAPTPHPNSDSLTTDNPTRAGSRRLRILGLENPSEAGRIDLHIRAGNNVFVETQNVDGWEIRLDHGGLNPSEELVLHQALGEVRIPSPWPEVYRRPNRRLPEGHAPAVAAIPNALWTGAQPLLVVVPHDTPPDSPLGRLAQRLARYPGFSDSLLDCARLRIVTDRAVDAAVMETHNLVILGTARENALQARLQAAGLPWREVDHTLQFDSQSWPQSEHAWVAGYFNPLAPARLIWCIAGDAAAGAYDPALLESFLLPQSPKVAPGFQLRSCAGNTVLRQATWSAAWTPASIPQDLPVGDLAQATQAAQRLAEALARELNADAHLALELERQLPDLSPTARLGDRLAGLPTEQSLVLVTGTPEQYPALLQAIASAQAHPRGAMGAPFPPLPKAPPSRPWRLVLSPAALDLLGRQTGFTYATAEWRPARPQDALLRRMW